MINKNKILVIIPARAGSKRLKNKNIKIINKKELIDWTIIFALKLKNIDKIIVSSDSKKILQKQKKYKNIEFIKRNKNLSKDNTQIIEVINNVLENYQNFDFVVVLQPTTPFRELSKTNNFIRYIVLNKKLSGFSAIEIDENLLWSFQNKNKKIVPINKKFPKNTNKDSSIIYYRPSGEIYIASTNWIKKNKSLINEKSDFYISNNRLLVDIDKEKDLEFAKFLISKRN